MRNVLLPVDGSDHAFQAVLYLIGFAKEYGPFQVNVANVEPKPLLWQTGVPPAAKAHLAMASVLHALNEAGLPHRSHVREGDAAETIVALTRELGCDTIVMGTRGLGGLALGSVTRKVLQLAAVPVVCIKAPG